MVMRELADGSTTPSGGRRIGLAAAALLVAAGLLAACVALPTTPSTIYDLTAPTEFNATSGTRGQILVAEPSAPKALDTDRIAARPSAGQYAYLDDAIWSDRLPKLLQARLMETLQNTGRVRAVGLPGQGLLIDYQVILDIRAFEVRGDYGVAAFAVKLLNDRNGRVVAADTFAADVVISRPDTPSAVAALDKTMDETFVSIAEWVLTRI